MNEDKKWMLMTYYCPTHGNQGRIEPVEITRGDLSRSISKKTKSQQK